MSSIPKKIAGCIGIDRLVCIQVYPGFRRTCKIWFRYLFSDMDREILNEILFNEVE